MQLREKTAECLFHRLRRRPEERRERSRLILTKIAPASKSAALV
jgi:hypothetical protein